MTNIRMFFYYTSLASTTGVFFRIIVPTYLTHVIHDRLSVLFNQSYLGHLFIKTTAFLL